MSVAQWLDYANATDHWDFEAPPPGTVVGSPVYVDGLGGGLAASTSTGNDGFVIAPRLPADTSTFTIALWLLPTAGAASGDVLRWGSTPGVGVEYNGTDGTREPGTVTVWARVSNGNYALRATTREPLSPGHWHLLVLTVKEVNYRGGIEARAYLDGSEFAAGQYLGGLFNWVNMDRPNSLSVLAGGAAAAVDDVGLLMRAITGSEVAALMAAGPRDTSTSRYGWGVAF